MSSQSIKKNKKAYQAKFDAQDKAYLNRVCLVWYDLILVVKIYHHDIKFEVPSNALTRLLPTQASSEEIAERRALYDAFNAFRSTKAARISKNKDKLLKLRPGTDALICVKLRENHVNST